MLCFKCGALIPGGGKFCPKCGATSHDSQTQPQSTDPYGQQSSSYGQHSPNPYGQPTPSSPYGGQSPFSYDMPPQSSPYGQHGYQSAASAGKKGSIWPKIAIAASGVVVVGLAVVVLMTLLMSSPQDNASEAMSKLSDEITERLDGTPLSTIGTLADSMQNGSTTVRVSYLDGYWGDYADADVTLMSSDGNYRLLMKLLSSDLDFDLDLDVYLNEERIAVQTELLGRDYYGITFATLRDDFQVFGDYFGLDRITMNMILSELDGYINLMDMQGLDFGYLSDFESLFEDFFDNLEPSSEKTAIQVGGSMVDCTKIEYVITEDDLVTFLRDFSNLFAVVLRDQLGSLSNSVLPGGMDFEDIFDVNSYADITREIDRAINDFERNYSGEITLSLYTGSGNRLMRIDFDANVGYGGDSVQLGGVFDFGASSTDRWTFELSGVDSWNNRYSVLIAWEYRTQGSTVINTLSASMSENGHDTNLGSLVSRWNTQNGDFTLSIEDQLGNELGALSGNLRVQSGGGFTLRFDNLFEVDRYSDGDKLSIEIIAEPGNVNIGRVDYINLDEWGPSLSGVLGELLGLGGFGW